MYVLSSFRVNSTHSSALALGFHGPAARPLRLLVFSTIMSSIQSDRNWLKMPRASRGVMPKGSIT